MDEFVHSAKMRRKSFTLYNLYSHHFQGDNPFPIGSTGGDGAVWIRSAGVGITGGVVLVATHQFLGTADVEIHFKL